MKHLLLFFTVAFVTGIHAQTDEFNLDKYWKFRNNFVEKFVKIGGARGESIPAGKRKPCTCIDNLYLSLPLIDCYGEIHWG